MRGTLRGGGGLNLTQSCRSPYCCDPHQANRFAVVGAWARHFRFGHLGLKLANLPLRGFELNRRLLGSRLRLRLGLGLGERKVIF